MSSPTSRLPSFWYPTAIAAITSAVITLTGNASSPPQTASTNKQPQAQPPYSAVLASANASDLPAASAQTLEPPKNESFEQAIALANQAVSAFQSAKQEPSNSLAHTRRERNLWKASLESLAAVPKSSAVYSEAAAKQSQYQQLLATAESKIATAESAFLGQIVKDAGLRPGRAHITLCQIDNPRSNLHTGPEKLLNPAHSSITAKTQVKNQINGQQCRHLQGDKLLASPASLIKLPIAIALLQKASAEGIDLNQPVKIDPNNFTENAEGATLEVGKSYPLREIVARMIDRSDNIATNQLIDTIDRDSLAQILTDMGYTDTYAGHKLVGDRVMPKDPGDRINQTTTNDLTAMLVRTYSLQAPGDQSLLRALQGQTDRELGYQALQASDLKGVQWLGEKTGQNQRVIGSTLAMQVGKERYALTVAIDHSGDAQAVREIIEAIALHLEKGAPLIGRSPT